LNVNAALAAHLEIHGWPRQIQWSEFRELAERPPQEDEDAQIHSVGGGADNIDVIHRGNTYQISSITVEMTVEDDSWVVRDRKSDSLLNHEQGHYDITALLWRDLATDLLALRAPTGLAKPCRPRNESISTHLRSHDQKVRPGDRPQP
jgi:hypothetical protein